MKVNKEILSIYEEILIYNKNILNEVSSSSDELFGGIGLKIPVDGAHAGQSGWQSGNAWDIPASVGTPVYALADGVAQTYHDYGSNVTATNGKRLYGQSFTVESSGGVPDIYYTHLSGSPIKKGSSIKCGQFLGSIMDFPNSIFDHVHIGVSSGSIRQFLNDDGSMKCAKGQKITGGEISNSTTSGSTNTSQTSYDAATTGEKKSGLDPFKSTLPDDTYLKDLTSSALNTLVSKGLTEQKAYINEQNNFGKDITNRFGRIIIPKDSNPKIKSPISGVVFNKRYNSSCTNQITIKNDEDETIYLEYCGITYPSVRDGQSISVGDVIGKTDSDVEVNMYNSSWRIIQIGSEGIKIKPKKEKEEKEYKKKDDSQKRYVDPVTAAVLSLPGKAFDKVFGDRYDKNGEMTQKRWGGVSDKKPVDPWLLNFIKDPLGRKKVTENIEKIKRLL